MKKLISATLAATLALSLAACGSSASTSEAAPAESTASSAAESAAESTAETSELAGHDPEGRCLPHAPCRDPECGQGDSGRAGHRPAGR